MGPFIYFFVVNTITIIIAHRAYVKNAKSKSESE